jgi:hypothetical protein
MVLAAPIARCVHLTGTHARRLEVRPHLGTTPAADPADKPVLDVGQPEVIRPEVGADPDVMAAMVIAAIDQHVATPEARISPKVIFCG